MWALMAGSLLDLGPLWLGSCWIWALLAGALLDLGPWWLHVGCVYLSFSMGCGSILGHLGASWGQLGAILGPSWGHLGASWGHLGASWGILGPSWNQDALDKPKYAFRLDETQKVLSRG